MPPASNARRDRRPRSAISGDALDARDPVEPAVERHDRTDIVRLHHREVQRIPRGESWRGGEEPARALDVREIDGVGDIAEPAHGTQPASRRRG